MSKPELVDLLTKMRRDKQYRAVVQSDPETALGRVTLTAAERDALVAWDPARLEAVGIGSELARAALRGRDHFAQREPVMAGGAGRGGGATGCG